MKKLFFFVVVLMSSFMMTASAQNLKTILKKHYSAIGQTALNKADVIVIKGKISQMGMELPFTVYQKKPGKALFEATFQEMKLVQAFNGKTGWSINPMSGPEPVDMGTSEIKSMKAMAEMDGRLYNWKKKGYKLSYDGNEEFEGKSFYKISVSTPDDLKETYFIDPVSYLVRRVDSQQKVQGMDVDATKLYSDYRDVNGYKAPFMVETKMMGEAAGDMQILSIEFKEAADVPDTMFEKPAGK